MIKQIILTEEEYNILINYKKEYYKAINDKSYDDESYYYRLLEKLRELRFFMQKELDFQKWYLARLERDGKDTAFALKRMHQLEKLLNK
jgi:hypothetical protein